MKIKNISGTAGKSCSCGSWMDHWRNHHPGLGVVLVCSHQDCFAIDVVGAHVVKMEGRDKDHYIVPLCKRHNNIKEVFRVTSNATLISANKSNTCAKKKKDQGFFGGLF